MTIINSIANFNKENKTNDKFSYSFLFHSTKSEEIINIIKKKLDNINKKIKNSFKKKYINERIFSLITYLECNYDPDKTINSLFFIDTQVHNLVLSKEDMKFINKWNISKFYMDYDEIFQIEYFTELFSTNSINTVFKFDKSSYDIIELDNTKSRKIEGHSSIDENSISEMIILHKPVVIYGMNQILKKLKNNFENIYIELKHMTNDDICEIISRKKISDNLDIFKSEILDNISNESVVDKFIFGKKEIGAGIENYMVKKLFINSKLLSLLKNKADKSVLNFTIIEIKSLETGDPGYILNKNYEGMVAIKYY